MMKRSHKMNVAAVIERLGGVPAIVVGLGEMGVKTHSDTIHHWQARGIIPMKQWLRLATLAQRRAIPLALEDFIF